MIYSFLMHRVMPRYNGLHVKQKKLAVELMDSGLEQAGSAAHLSFCIFISRRTGQG